jgi:hypothetical protein
MLIIHIKWQIVVDTNAVHSAEFAWFGLGAFMDQCTVFPDNHVAFLPEMRVDEFRLLDEFEQGLHHPLIFLIGQADQSAGETAADIKDFLAGHRMFNDGRVGLWRTFCFEVLDEFLNRTVEITRLHFVTRPGFLHGHPAIHITSQIIGEFAVDAGHVDVRGFPGRFGEEDRAYRGKGQRMFLETAIRMPVAPCTGNTEFFAVFIEVVGNENLGVIGVVIIRLKINLRPAYRSGEVDLFLLGHVKTLAAHDNQFIPVE